jgi:hypothetical protein
MGIASNANLQVESCKICRDSLRDETASGDSSGSGAKNPCKAYEVAGATESKMRAGLAQENWTPAIAIEQIRRREETANQRRQEAMAGSTDKAFRASMEKSIATSRLAMSKTEALLRCIEANP